MYTLVLSDALARWHRVCGRSAVLMTGTDEHGLKIQQAAQRAGSSPQQFCDVISQRFRALVAATGCDVADFVRTTEPRHAQAVAALWVRLREAGYIYRGVHEGWYSVPDEAFVPEAQTELRTDAQGQTIRVSTESGHAVEWVKEDNYKFRLSAFGDRLRAWLQDHPETVQPASRHNEVVGWLDKGLADISVSRLTERVQWGLPVPDDPAHTVYVWLDALTNYLTVAGYPWPADDPEALRRRSWFPPTHQIIGKDILRFHCLYWPAFLMAAGLPLPKQLVAHAHWTVERQKMSKSLGNVVDPFALVDKYGSDAVRFFLLREADLTNDADFSHDLLRTRVNHDLADQLGNLISRAIAPSLLPDQRWPHPRALDSEDHRLLASVARLPGLESIFALVADANRYCTERKPWLLRARAELAAAERLDTTIYVVLVAARAALLLLQPILPNITKGALDMLGEPATARTLAHVPLATTVDGTQAEPLADVVGRAFQRSSGGVLFPRLAADANRARK